MSRKVESFQKDYFYSRPCGRGDASKTCTVSCVFVFLLTPLREGRLARDHGKKVLLVISTHAPAGGATISLLPRNRRARFLLTPLREGRRENRAAIAQVRYISTHAPAGGATGLIHKADIDIVISTHAPAGGATRPGERGVDDGKNFYSRPCGRGDCDRVIAWRIGGNFYSRPCGRGDPTSQPEPQRRPNFYSRPCGRGDFARSVGKRGGREFLLTPLREGRRRRTAP